MKGATMTTSPIILLLAALAFSGCVTHKDAGTQDSAAGKPPTVILVPVMVMPSQGQPSESDPAPLIGPLPPQHSAGQARPGNSPVKL